MDRCKCEGVEVGFVKISAREGTDEILGATIVGPTAGDMISAITLCSKWRQRCALAIDSAGLKTHVSKNCLIRRVFFF